MCELWKSFVNFKEDMEPTWKPGLEIDRIDPNGNYTAENCRWANHHTQLRNYGRNVFHELNGVRKVTSDWASDLGGNHRIIEQRLRLGWSLKKALTHPVRR